MNNDTVTGCYYLSLAAQSVKTPSGCNLSLHYPVHFQYISHTANYNDNIKVLRSVAIRSCVLDVEGVFTR
ncbi:hypothetical protein BaRGS_00011520 [Batillaria attramentaria]|uniref:Uncharacterized protein n=1 Tax=Batillaria attramentaria TaxID=370345 RepID=A0ABD0LCZ2_9CAEN